MNKPIVMHDGFRAPGDYAQLREFLRAFMRAEVTRTQNLPGAERDIDRVELAGVFARSPFGSADLFGVDLHQPVGDLLQALAALDDDLIVAEMLVGLYPTGQVDPDELSPIGIPESFGPAD